MPAAKRVGVSDIAKHAGVSIGTVSNYLNYPERVSDTLKEKIGASIKELGYTPRRNTLLPQRENAGPRLIGYIMTDIEHSLFTFIHEGAQEVCEENDLQLIALNASSDAQRQNELVKALFDMNVAGLLVSFLLKQLIPKVLASLAGMEMRCAFTWWLILGSILFAGVVALIAAWIPARKAMNISPNEAIRRE